MKTICIQFPDQLIKVQSIQVGDTIFLNTSFKPEILETQYSHPGLLPEC